MNCCISSIFLYGLTSVLISFGILCFILKKIINPYPNVKRRKNEENYYDSQQDKSFPFPTIDDPSTIHLSVIVPAYNEEERLPSMLDECLLYLGTRGVNFNYEIIVVSDGSRDKTVQVAQNYTTKYGSNIVRILELTQNRGKGGAVRLGVQSARGAIILFADADGATKFSDIFKLEEALRQLINENYIQDPQTVASKKAIVIGSRAHLEKEAIATRSIFRTFLMYGFHFLVWFFAVRDLKDTQCGFKLFTREAARICFSNLHVERWAFDVELLYIAQRLSIPIKEVSVNWTEIEGSKVTPVFSWIQMGCDLGLIWLKYKINAWKLVSDKRK